MSSQFHLTHTGTGGLQTRLVLQYYIQDLENASSLVRTSGNVTKMGRHSVAPLASDACPLLLSWDQITSLLHMRSRPPVGHPVGMKGLSLVKRRGLRIPSRHLCPSLGLSWSASRQKGDGGLGLMVFAYLIRKFISDETFAPQITRTRFI